MFEFSLWVGSIFYILAAWLALLLIFFSDGGHEDDFSHELKDPKKVLFRQHFSPSSMVTFLVVGNWSEKDGLSLDLPFCLNRSLYIVFHWETAALSRKWLFVCSCSWSAFLVRIFSWLWMPCQVRVFYRQVLSLGMTITFVCGF
jgi:hypothetical protein